MRYTIRNVVVIIQVNINSHSIALYHPDLTHVKPKEHPVSPFDQDCQPLAGVMFGFLHNLRTENLII